MKEKLHSCHGDTFLEILVALLVAVMASAMLGTGILRAGEMWQKYAAEEVSFQSSSATNQCEVMIGETAVSAKQYRQVVKADNAGSASSGQRYYVWYDIG